MCRWLSWRVAALAEPVTITASTVAPDMQKLATPEAVEWAVAMAPDVQTAVLESGSTSREEVITSIVAPDVQELWDMPCAGDILSLCHHHAIHLPQPPL